MIMIERDEVKFGGSAVKYGGDPVTGAWVLKGVAVTEMGVGNKREPMLRNAFETEQRSSWHANENLCKEVFHVGYGLGSSSNTAAPATMLQIQSPALHHLFCCNCDTETERDGQLSYKTHQTPTPYKTRNTIPTQTKIHNKCPCGWVQVQIAFLLLLGLYG